MLMVETAFKKKELNLSKLFSDHQFSSTEENETALRLCLKEKVIDQESLLKVSIRLGVAPTTLRKILAGQPPSTYIFKKLSQRLQNWTNPSADLLKTPKIQRLLFIHRIYQEKGTLAAVGKEVGLTRERIRQLLKQGEALGLFEYKKPEVVSLPLIPKTKLTEDYRNLLQFKLVAKTNGISHHQFYQLLKYYQITRKELETIRTEGRRLKSIRQYYIHVKRLGRHPSTTDLQKSGKGQYLSSQINRLWGSIHTFRKHLDIPSPKFGNR